MRFFKFVAGIFHDMGHGYKYVITPSSVYRYSYDDEGRVAEMRMQYTGKVRDVLA